MNLVRKTEEEMYRKQQDEMLKEEKKYIFRLENEDFRSKKQTKQDHLDKIKQLDDKLLEELENKSWGSRKIISDSPSSRFSSYPSLAASRNHLDKVKELHEKARNMIKGRHYLQEISERPSPVKMQSETPSPVKMQCETPSPVKIPVFIPQSMMRKAHNLPPPTMQRVLKNGDIITVHLLSDKSRVNDPLIKTEAQIDQNELKTLSKQFKGKPLNQIYSDIQKQFIDGDYSKVNRTESLPIKKKYRNDDFELPKAEIPELRHSSTPIGRVECFIFRDIALNVVSHETNRDWVSKRMKQYSDKVKEKYLPKACEKKEIEMILMKEKLKKEKTVTINRIKVLRTPEF
ncbi:hypothetical protein SteCoe_27655 [Stentor coeruleus]|uniref:Uncharacterized protein n=1 Tax=Stentor coeruleus TaxID=5963 RepID=A0A1R2B9Y9_9CILI|nr:hypothetical protein SteCoe_27655 [Stentor coeruleus]